jgi:hypothetical protein
MTTAETKKRRSHVAFFPTALPKVLPMQDTTKPGNPPTTSDSREACQVNRLADPSKPLSVPEAKQYTRVRSAAWLLRYCEKKISLRRIALLLKEAGKPMRMGSIAAYLNRFYELETLKTRGRKHPGNIRETDSTYDGNIFKHGGKQRVSTTEILGKQPSSNSQIPSLESNVNTKDNEEKTKRNDEGRGTMRSLAETLKGALSKPKKQPPCEK